MPSIVIRKVPRPRNTRKPLALVKCSAVVERREVLVGVDLRRLGQHRHERQDRGDAGGLEQRDEQHDGGEDIEAAPLARRQQVHQHPAGQS